jgi:hypothetical protein
VDEYLQWSVDERRAACQQAAATLGLPAESIEKDYWVSPTLRELFGLAVWGPQLTFKGGTSLSKGWKLIDRFSEDIDVVVNREFLGFGGPLRRKAQKRLVEACSQRIRDELLPALRSRLRELLPGTDGDLVMADAEMDPQEQTILFSYPPFAAPDQERYVRPLVRIELGARSDTDPAETPTLSPLLTDAMPDAFAKPTFSVRTVAPGRTFWEKATLMHEELQRPGAAVRDRLARHLYDLWSMLQRGVVDPAAVDRDLFESVVRHRQEFFRRGGVDYDTMRLGSLRFVPEGAEVGAWGRDYEAMREAMFYGEPPRYGWSWTERQLRPSGRSARRFTALRTSQTASS